MLVHLNTKLNFFGGSFRLYWRTSIIVPDVRMSVTDKELSSLFRCSRVGVQVCNLRDTVVLQKHHRHLGNMYSMVKIEGPGCIPNDNPINYLSLVFVCIPSLPRHVEVHIWAGCMDLG